MTNVEQNRETERLRPTAHKGQPQGPANAHPIARPAFDPLDPQWQPDANIKPAANGKPSAAAKPLDAAEAARAEKAGTLVMAARLALKRGDKAEARTRLQEALIVDPRDCAALELVGDILLEEAEQEKAIQVFERGLKYHPAHHAFEEKIALALLDIEEMKRDAQQRDLLLTVGDKDKWQDRKPGIAISLSLLVPGMGQFYNDEAERGWVFLGAAAFTFLGWYLPLSRALSGLQGTGARQLVARSSEAIANMGFLAKGWFWLMIVAALAIWIYSAYDALSGTERYNRARRPFFGV
ncbi:MAG: hypothetical protein JWN98_1377 [Abditibacteriota bacterium]|nr:hypothetical protein [Abditibacteriota bacterium]